MARRVFIREIYFYIVCLVALIIFIIGIVNIYDNAINYIRPSTYMTRGSILPSYQQQYPGLSDEEVNKLIDDEMTSAIDNERIFAVKGLFRGVLLVIIAIPLFAFHWRKAQIMWRLNIE